jgi:hypothetical protein
MATTATETNPTEDIIRDYLRFLEDDEALVDQDKKKLAEEAVELAKQGDDPIAHLKALANLTAISSPDPEPLRQAFTKQFKGWCETHAAGLTPELLHTEMGVPISDLQAAGFEIHSEKSQRSPAAARAAATGRQRAVAVPVEKIRAGILDKFKDGKPFLLAAIIEDIGGSQATVRKTLDELIEEGLVEKMGPMPDYNGRGRAPLQYKLLKGKAKAAAVASAAEADAAAAEVAS